MSASSNTFEQTSPGSRMIVGTIMPWPRLRCSFVRQRHATWAPHPPPGAATFHLFCFGARNGPIIPQLMPLSSGTKIGVYEVSSLLGVGGMGEVYRSRDSKLGRQVALKVLPAGVAADTERLARFSREAKVLAALNHPNIASIYGLEDSGAIHALVMELVEGPTLADRIKTGAIPIAAMSYRSA